ncbi:MAG: flagellar biosynthetic protein FliR [Cellvibrionaceae bacterium]
MFTITDQELLAYVGNYFFPFCRIGAFFLAVPIIGTQLVSARIRVVLSIMVTMLAAPLIPDSLIIPSLNLQTFIIVVQQVIIGIAMGFIVQVIFQLFVLTGQFIAMKIGLGFASMNDPSSGVTVTVISQFYMMTSTLLFLSLNGHLILIEVLVKSFSTLPMSLSGLSQEGLMKIVSMGSWMFEGALVVALPVLTSLLVVNIAFGVMSKSAPQMNVFAVGFPITLVFGLLLLWFSFTSFLPNYQALVNEGLLKLNDIVGLP